MKKWNPKERPWEEHAKWRPDCAFLQLMKGEEFVDKVHQRGSKKGRNMTVDITLEEPIKEKVNVFLVTPDSS